MKLVVGFGNPENKYNFTRHNFGFLALDFFAKIHNLDWQDSKKFNAKIIKLNNTILLKPNTYYNLVGESISSAINYYKISLDDLLIICDDLSLEFGKIRLRQNGTDGGNNGLKSTIGHLKTTNFARLKLGTKNQLLNTGSDYSDFVLSKFTQEEMVLLPKILSNTKQRIEDFISQSSLA